VSKPPNQKAVTLNNVLSVQSRTKVMPYSRTETDPVQSRDSLLNIHQRFDNPEGSATIAVDVSCQNLDTTNTGSGQCGTSSDADNASMGPVTDVSNQDEMQLPGLPAVPDIQSELQSGMSLQLLMLIIRCKRYWALQRMHLLQR
jgi:hypothetical protein